MTSELRRRLLERTGLTEQELADCASVALPEATGSHLDLSPAEVVRALNADDLEALRRAGTVWQSGWEPTANLTRLLAGLRALLLSRPENRPRATGHAGPERLPPGCPPAARFYTDALDHIVRFGRIRHAQLMSSAGAYADQPPTELVQRVMMRLRGKLRYHPPASHDVAGLGELLDEDRT